MKMHSKVLAATLGAAAISALAAFAYKKSRSKSEGAMPAYPETAGARNADTDGNRTSVDMHPDDAPLSVSAP